MTKPANQPPKWNFQMRGDRSAEVLIYSDIGDYYYGGVSAKSFAEELRALGDIDELTVRINSRGGSITEGFAIYETLRQHKAKVIIKIEGIAASIASLVAMAGDEVQITESAFFMIHRGWNVCVGDADAMRHTASVLEMMEVKLMDAYLRRAKDLDRVELFNMLKAETWMDAEQCKEHGFADTIIAPDQAANLAFDLSVFKHPPAALKDKDTGPNTKLAALKATQAEAEAVAIRLRLLDVDDAAQ